MRLSIRMSRLLLVVAAIALCASRTYAGEKPQVATFSTILTEIAQRVGGDDVQVIGLIKPGTDPHEFQPRPADLKVVGDAQLILLSAKHMEGYLDKVKEATGTRGALVQVGDQFPSLKLAAESGHGGTIEDPHWWHSIDNMKRATHIVEAELSKIAPAAQSGFAARAATYTRELDDLDRWAKSEVAKLPRDQRKLVTSHDAFQYFARAYGFTIYPIEGVTHEDEPSAKKVADLIAVIQAQHVKAIFLEDTLNPKVTREITRESGAKIGGTLIADGLTGTPEGDTYARMFRHNVTTIVEALR